jgi:hypothetical protein
VKLADFNALCDREWRKPRRGDVVSIRLAPESAAELAGDVAIAGGDPCHPLVLYISEEDIAAEAAGLAITRLTNPVTRTVVKIRAKQGGERDTARVAVMGGTYRQTWWAAKA